MRLSALCNGLRRIEIKAIVAKEVCRALSRGILFEADVCKVWWKTFNDTDYKNTVTSGLWLHANLKLYFATNNVGYLNNATALMKNFCESVSLSLVMVLSLITVYTVDSHPQLMTANGTYAEYVFHKLLTGSVF